MKTLWTTALLFICLTATAGASQIDINNIREVADWGLIPSSAGSRGQTFRMGQRGTLDSITISIGGVAWDNRDVMLALCAVDGLQFDVLEVSEQILDVGQPQKLYTFPFDRTLFDRGEELGFVLVGHYVWIGLTAEEFADSRPIINSDPWDPPFEYLSDYNAVFSTAITPVPEPSTIALALVAIAAFRMRLIKRT